LEFLKDIPTTTKFSTSFFSISSDILLYRTT